VPHDINKTKEIVFPNDTIATMFGGAQIKIPRNTLIHQRDSNSEDVLFFFYIFFKTFLFLGMVVQVVSFVAKNLQLYSDPSIRYCYSIV